MGLRVTPIDHFGEAAAGGSRAGVRELRGADCAGPGQRQHQADWTFADESAHPDSALEWWFLQGLVDGEHSGRVYFMLSLFRHRLETGTDDPDHGHGLLLSVLEPTAGNHRVASWVDEPAVHSVVGRPGLPSLTNLDRRLSVAFIDEVHRNGPLRGTTQTASLPSFGNRPLTVSWSSLEIEQRSDAIDLSFAEPGTNRPWRMRLVPAGHRAALDAVRGIGKHGHSMEVITYPRLTVRGSVGDDAVDGTAWFDHQWGDRGWFFSGGDSGRVLGWEWLGSTSMTAASGERRSPASVRWFRRCRESSRACLPPNRMYCNAGARIVAVLMFGVSSNCSDSGQILRASPDVRVYRSR